MRVALESNTPREPYLNIWKLLNERSSCLNVKFVSRTDWMRPNMSHFDILTNSTHIDTLEDLWAVSDERQQVLMTNSYNILMFDIRQCIKFYYTL